MPETQPSPAMGPKPQQLVDFFSRSLASLRASRVSLRILCTLPHRGDSPSPRRPGSSARRLVVLDSSFNPPTRAHAHMARAAVRDAGPGARLLLLLAVNNADKAPRPASPALRLAMMDAFARGLQRGDAEGEAVGEIDVGVTTMALFHDKARAVAESGFYGEPEPELVFVVGFDTLVRILDPKYYDRQSPSPSSSSPAQTPMQAALGPLFARARLRVTLRPDDAWGSLEEQRAYVRALDEAWATSIDAVDAAEDTARVSSSRARDAVRRAGPMALDGLVDGQVRAWIERERLYEEAGRDG